MVRPRDGQSGFRLIKTGGQVQTFELRNISLFLFPLHPFLCRVSVQNKERIDRMCDADWDTCSYWSQCKYACLAAYTLHRLEVF